jgi:hypothetical protein
MNFPYVCHSFTYVMYSKLNIDFLGITMAHIIWRSATDTGRTGLSWTS